jgi:hypothetical protein
MDTFRIVGTYRVVEEQGYLMEAEVESLVREQTILLAMASRRVLGPVID